MKTQISIVILGIAACQGNLHTGTENPGDAGLGDSGVGGSRAGGIVANGGNSANPAGGIGSGGIVSAPSQGGQSSAIENAAGGAAGGTVSGTTTGPVTALDASADAPTDSDGGCPSGTHVYYTAPGCGAEARPRCGTYQLDSCAALVYRCACDGVTTTTTGDCGSDIAPYLYEGACRSDAGSGASGAFDGGRDGITDNGSCSGNCADARDAEHVSRSYSGIFVTTGSMAVGREFHTATLLPSGKVLLAGGGATAELYDPSTGTFAATGSMAVSRDSHTATLLPNGKVLMVGGVGGGSATAELYDPSTGTFAATGNLKFARISHTATLLNNGLVLIAGGDNGIYQEELADAGYGSEVLPAAAELYDPATGTFTVTGSLTLARIAHTATLLANGQVLIAGGRDGQGFQTHDVASAELYDPRAATFRATAAMNVPKSGHTATLLNNGLVLIVGGNSDVFSRPDGGVADAGTAELYDPSTGTFAAAGQLNTGRSDHTATLLLNGRVLVAGGVSVSGVLASSEIYDPATSSFVATGNMTGTRMYDSATLLQDGTVLLAGGVYGGRASSASAELYE